MTGGNDSWLPTLLTAGISLSIGVAALSCSKECDCDDKGAAAAMGQSSAQAAATAGTPAPDQAAGTPTPAQCEALLARTASDRSFEGINGTIETGADETHTVSPQGGSKITLDREGSMKLVDPAGRRLSLRPDGTVEEANYDVLLVAPDGSRKVYWASQKRLVDFEEYTKKMAEGAEATDATEETTSASAAKRDSDEGAGDKQGKVTICHVPPGNPANEHTITVSPSAVDAHLRHGDYRGPCTGRGKTQGSSKSKGKSKGKKK